LVWRPKRRKPVLAGKVKERLEQVIHQVADELGIKVLEVAINPDHILVDFLVDFLGGECLVQCQCLGLGRG
jgi:hypothetical protein